MSQVSFLDTDITGIRFSDRTTWGGQDKFKIIEELWLEDDLSKPARARRVSIGGVLSVYRNLRENYEFRRRYDEAGLFFIKEMEIKRKYQITNSNEICCYKGKNWVKRNFSLTGLYFHLSRYGENLSRPTCVGIGIIVFATLLFCYPERP